MKNIYNSAKKAFKLKPRLQFILMCLVVAFSVNMEAQVTVAGSTGANASYTTLKAAFDAINLNNNQTGNAITISITASTTELAPAVLNQPTAGSWATLTISPSGGAAITVTGASPLPLIGLNGADNVTIDGLNTGGNSLTISNTSTSSTGAATIVYYADASNNILQNCTVSGSSTSATLATIAFSTGTTTGNDGNTITGCTITSAGTNLPFNAIGSAGTSALIDNSGISITNNNIQDYYSPGSASNGVFVSAFSSAWTITGNKFFQTAARTASAGATHRAINIVTASGGGYVISNNTIGYATSTATGVTTYDGGFASRFLGIELTAAATPVSSIQGNTIAAITLSTTSGATLAPGIFSGISVLGGTVNIGTTTGNTIGAATGTGSISITTTTSLPYIAGIYAKSTGTVSIQNNTIASILTTGTAGIGYTFNGINTAGTAGNFTVSGNTIGSTTTAHSIAIGTSGTTTAICKFRGIYNAASGTISITGNTIQNTSSFGTGASAYTGILVDSASATGTLSIGTNNIISGTNTGTGAFTGISNTAVSATANINNNIIRNNVIASTTGTFTGIVNSGVVTTAINFKDNQLGNSTGGLVTYSAANSGALKGLSNTDGAITALLSVTGNDIRGITNTVATSSDHVYISNSTFKGSTNISTNTFTTLNVNTTGDVTFISNNVSHNAGTSHSVNSNAVITGYNNTGAGGTVFFYNSYALSPSTVTEINTSNNFSNLAFAGSTTISGWRSSDGTTPGPKKTVTNNTFRNITAGSGTITIINAGYADNTSATNNISGNTIANIIGGADITGILSEWGNQNFFNNTVDSLLSSGSGTVTGISITDGTTQNVFKNKIYYLSNSNASGAVDGLSISGSTTLNVYNNIIGDLRTPASTFTDAIRGISITSTSSSSTINAYYNTVYINATSSATNFGTSGIFHATSTTATTAALNLRNNIIVNTSTPLGTGLTVAYRRSAGSANSLANYAATSNNNLFYAGTPGTANLIYSDGVSSAQTMAAYKAGAFTAGTIASRDVSSITENPTFVSTIGSNLNFLHINTTVATQIESGAVNIAPITDDFDADIRQGNPGYTGTGTSTDIGADEFNGVAIDLIAPAISYTALTNNSCLVNDTVSATITDGTGINTTAGTKPRIWFKKTSNLNTLPGTNTNTTNGWKYTEATNSTSPFSLVLDYALVFGGVAVGDTVQYFVVAQDVVSPTPNISANSGTFAAPPTSVALTIAAFPIGGTINSYKILGGLSGTVTVGTGGTYTTLTGASGLFAAINTNGLAGNLIADILTGTTETGANALNSIGYGCSSNYTLLIKPSTGVTATLTGSSATALIKLNGADYVTFDGSNSGGTTRDLTITNTNTGTSSAVIWIGSASVTDGATNNTVKNCILTGNAPTTTLAGIISSSGTTIGGVAEAANANNTYQNNVINTSSYGIAVVGPATGESVTTISNNLIGSATAINKIGFRGMFISNQTNFIASNNTIFGVTTSGTSTTSGIMVAGAISGGIINANKISDVKNTNTGGYGCNGILLSASSTASNIIVSNNMIFDIAGYGWSSDGSGDNGYGIIITNGGGYNVYYNTVSMNTNQTDITGLPAAFNVTSGVTTANSLNVRNNIFSNSQTTGTERFSVICNAANTVFTDINYNDYDAGTAPNLGYFGSNTANLAAWKIATGKDVNSLSVVPVFTSVTDLHLVVASNCAIDHTGTPITGIIADIDNDTRDASNPDIGADEFTNPAPVLSSSLTPTAICSGATFTYTATSTTSGATFGWSRATIAGITEVGTTGTANISEVLTNTTGLPINVIYVYTTTFTLCSNIQNVTVTVNPNPSLSSSLTPPSICTGTAFTYTPTSLSSGAAFTWARAAVTGISNLAATGSGNVNETLTNTTTSPISVTYVYITTANGCTNAPGQNVVVTVGQIPVLSSSLTPSVCSGTTFTYTATSTTPGVSFTWTRATVSGITEPGTSGTANVSEILTNTTTSPVTVTYAYITNASGCAGGSQNVVVTVFNKPTVSLAPFTDTVCFQAPAFALTGGSPAGGTYAGAGVSSGMFNPSTAGVGPISITYTVTVSSCSNATSQNIIVEQCAGIEENSFSQAVTTYPNPNNGKFNITISNVNFDQLSISIVDLQGKEVYYELDKNNTAEYSKQIDVKSLAKGIYYIKLVTDADVAIQKLVIE
ncbi:MAG: T9SS type A sorting domain-containing protein [Bacteroidota bacterium]